MKACAVAWSSLKPLADHFAIKYSARADSMQPPALRISTSHASCRKASCPCSLRTSPPRVSCHTLLDAMHIRPRLLWLASHEAVAYLFKPKVCRLRSTQSVLKAPLVIAPLALDGSHHHCLWRHVLHLQVHAYLCTRHLPVIYAHTSNILLAAPYPLIKRGHSQLDTWGTLHLSSTSKSCFSSNCACSISKQ